MIPTVKTWIFTFEDGSKAEVLAPTKMLAGMNLRANGDYRPYVKLGQKRKN